MDAHRIRRCLNCGYKTHHRYWKGDVCPICENASSYVESTHGGLGPVEIFAAKKNLRDSLNSIEDSYAPITATRRY